jgi:hypothetical protein
MTLREARELAKRNRLVGPARFYGMSLYDLQALIGNGKCGPGQKMGDWLVPDTVYGLSIHPACAIHDYEYAMISSPTDRYKADGNFLMNMMTLVDKNTSRMFLFGTVLRALRHRRVMKYYEAVRIGGGRFLKVRSGVYTQ